MPNKKVLPPNTSMWARVTRHQIVIPIIALVILAVFNLINDPSFFSITMKPNANGDNILTGNIISIIDSGSELAILALGMTLVTAASGGQDISVGAAIAISGSVLMRVVNGGDPRSETIQNPIIVAFLVAVLVSMAFGAFNGALVAYFKIQPMVATLILFTAGRNIASWINNSELPVVKDESFGYFGNYIPGLPIPTPFLIAVACFIIFFLVMKFTNLGLYVQSVGINDKTSRLNGLNPELIKLLTYVILGVCVAVAALIKVSRISQINYSVIAKDIEMDAILAVALGGNALSGGKFSLAASVLGAYVIQFLTTTLYALEVNAAALPAYKAVVVIVLVVISSPAVKEKFAQISKKFHKNEAAASKA